MRTFDIASPDTSMRQQIQQRIDNLNKPKGSLGRLETLAQQIALVQQTLTPELLRPTHLLFGADHGIEREGVSVSPRCITWQQMINFTRGGGGINMFCRQHGFALRIVDVGVDYDLMEYPGIINRKIAPGTRNCLHEAAMTQEEFDRAIEVGVLMVRDCAEHGTNVLSIGEMGIANTSPSSLWMSILGNLPLSECVGAGAGLDAPGIAHKLEVLTQVHQRVTEVLQPYAPDSKEFVLELCRQTGGFEMVAAMGAMFAAAENHMIILVDGFIMTACMLAVSRLYPDVLQYAIFAHQGDESGHKRMIQLMDGQPLLSLGLRLGEGTGAVCAYPLLVSAVHMMNEMNTFDGAAITKYF